MNDSMPFIDIRNGNLQESYSSDIERRETGMNSEIETSNSEMSSETDLSEMSSIYQPTKKRPKGFSQHTKVMESLTNTITESLTNSSEEIQRSFSSLFKRTGSFNPRAKFDDSGNCVDDGADHVPPGYGPTRSLAQYTHDVYQASSDAFQVGRIISSSSSVSDSSSSHSSSSHTLETKAGRNGTSSAVWSAIPRAFSSQSEEARDDEPTMTVASSPLRDEFTVQSVQSSTSTDDESWHGTASREVSLLDRGGSQGRENGTKNNEFMNHNLSDDGSDDEDYISDEYDEFDDLASVMYRVGSCAYTQNSFSFDDEYSILEEIFKPVFGGTEKQHGSGSASPRSLSGEEDDNFTDEESYQELNNGKNNGRRRRRGRRYKQEDNPIIDAITSLAESSSSWFSCGSLNTADWQRYRNFS